MINLDEYPVYNNKNRPGMGRDHLGNVYYNCFTVTFDKNENGGYKPYTFSTFIKQFNVYSYYANTCISCVAKAKTFTYSAEHENTGKVEVDRTAIEAKFNYGEVNDENYYYCPLINQILKTSRLSATYCEDKPDAPAKPIQAILWKQWDDSFLFEFHAISPPENAQICPIIQEVKSNKFTATNAERCFWEMWLLSAFHQMDIFRQSGKRIYWEDTDFDWEQTKVFDFIFPVPQVWLYVIPKPPPHIDWQEWERHHKQENLPQRVDFLFAYNGKRHIIELDDKNHYGVLSKGTWLASETQYRQTLSDTRWLKRCGYEMHRFTNEEILSLYGNNSPDIRGFTRLLRMEGLEPENMVFLRG